MLGALVTALFLPGVARAQATPDSASRIARAPSDSAAVQLTPARPRQGSIVRIRVRLPSRDAVVDTAGRVPVDTAAGGAAVIVPRADTVSSDSARADSTRGRIVAIRGTLFGEPLHFMPADSGAWVAIGGIPVDAPKTVRLPLIVERGGAPSDTMPIQLAIERTAYRMEKLTVAPKFGQAPDSALAARIAREQALAAAVSRASHETPRLWTGAFSLPRSSRVTSGFGGGREFNGAVQSRHMGLDLAGAVGAPVLASDRGVVALVGEFYLAGNVVYVDHGAGLVTAYFHLSAVTVAKGDTVTAGDTIGKVGATGRVTGPHLHWVARYGGITIDPSTLLDLAPPRRTPPSPASARFD
jgi:murein DD-endopeptidase MepM/ murein hydrolase activator NlpD